mmetsp:Transcript_63503/g.101047  ORF Transcript_63503/g.101047 Transcript_63503/m.101047 type:complete len:294 (-) Transcript_63503:871-1752(-)
MVAFRSRNLEVGGMHKDGSLALSVFVLVTLDVMRVAIGNDGHLHGSSADLELGVIEEDLHALFLLVVDLIVRRHGDRPLRRRRCLRRDEVVDAERDMVAFAGGVVGIDVIANLFLDRLVGQSRQIDGLKEVRTVLAAHHHVVAVGMQRTLWMDHVLAFQVGALREDEVTVLGRLVQFDVFLLSLFAAVSVSATAIDGELSVRVFGMRRSQRRLQADDAALSGQDLVQLVVPHIVVADQPQMVGMQILAEHLLDELGVLGVLQQLQLVLGLLLDQLGIFEQALHAVFYIRYILI